MAIGPRPMAPPARRATAWLVLATLAVGCGTTSRATRLHMAVTTSPPDSTVVVRHGDQVLASGPAPLALDETRDVTVHRRGGYWAAIAACGLGLVVGGVLISTSGDGSDGHPAIGRAMSAFAFGPALVFGAVGLIGLAATQDPPFTATATHGQIRFPVIEFEPGDALRAVHLEAPRQLRNRSDAAGPRREEPR